MHSSDPAPAMQQAAQLHRAGRLAEAEQIYREVLLAYPGHVFALHNLGLIALQTGRLDIAEQYITRSIQLDPSKAEFHSNLASVFNSQHQPSSAADAANRAIAINPKSVMSHFNLALALEMLEQSEKAIDAYRAALVLDPDNVVVLNNLGGQLRAGGQIEQAAECYRRAISISPGFAGAHLNLALVLKDQNRIVDAIASMRQAVKLAPTDAALHSNLLLLLHCHPQLTCRQLFDEHLAWAQKHAEPLAAQIRPHTNQRAPDRRLRIGYVSSDFKRHPVAFFVEPVLRAHNRSQFEIFCYASIASPDDVTRRLAALPLEWRDVTQLDDRRVAEEIRADQIDILIDLSGHTALNRLLVFAQRPAPIQATWIGYPNTTGLSSMDYWITDRYLHPPGQTEKSHIEALLVLPETFALYQPPDEAPSVQKTRASASGAITFGCFNSIAKLSMLVIELWSRVLKSVPRSRLHLKDAALQDASVRRGLAGQFQAFGITDDRLQFSGWEPLAGYLDAYREIDILLDPFPFTGHTTSLHGIWMGVPLITLAGDSHIFRRGVSILENLQLRELIATSPDHYVEIAVNLAADAPRLRALHAGLRQRLAESPLMDAPRFMQHFEAALRSAWASYCSATRD
jgi:predicted O-linked N-acetylglucosamine transferase (SPINDLY family)